MGRPQPQVCLLGPPRGASNLGRVSETDDAERPILGISIAEAARILGVREPTVSRLVAAGMLHKPAKHMRYGLDRDEVEQVALQRYKPCPPYWLTSEQAGQVLGISSGRVNQLARAGRLPFVQQGGHRLYRTRQIEVIANARQPWFEYLAYPRTSPPSWMTLVGRRSTRSPRRSGQAHDRG